MPDHKITLQTQPRVVEIGDEIELQFQAEVAGDVYLQRYADYAGAIKTKAADDAADGEVDTGALIERARANRAANYAFLKEFMLPESAAEFDTLALPDRVVTELVRWVAEAYGSAGGKGGGRGSSSNASAAASSTPGKGSTRRSQSKGSKPGRGH